MNLEQITRDSLLQEKAKVNFIELYREVIRKIETLVSPSSSGAGVLESSKARFEQSLNFKDLTCSCILDSPFFDITEENEVYPGIKGSFNDITVTCTSRRPGGTGVVLSIMGISGEPFIPKIQVEKAVERISVEVLNGDYRELSIQNIVKRITNAKGSNLKVERLLFGPKLFTKDRELEVHRVTFSKIVAKKIEFRSGAIIENMDTPTVTEGFECWLDAKSKADLTKLNIQNGNNKTISTIVMGETILRSQWDMLERVFEKWITRIRLQVASTRMPFGVGRSESEWENSKIPSSVGLRLLKMFRQNLTYEDGKRVSLFPDTIYKELMDIPEDELELMNYGDLEEMYPDYFN